MKPAFQTKVYAVLALLGIGVSVCAETYSFAAVADPRMFPDSWQNALTEIRDLSVNPSTPVKFRKPEFFVVAGDIDTIWHRDDDYKKVFKNVSNPPAFAPAVGNHEFDNPKTLPYLLKTLLPRIPGYTKRQGSGIDYYFDHKTTRIICVDAYSDLGYDGCLNEEGIKWVQDVIDAAPSAIRHIFITMHEPPFPRARHLTDSFNECPQQRDKFWNMLVARADRVRAVFVGHTHVYSRMRVKDPTSACANKVGEPSKTKVFGCLPDDPGGIYQIDCGGTGVYNAEKKNTVVTIQIVDNKVYFRTHRAELGAGQPFALGDEWLMEGPAGVVAHHMKPSGMRSAHAALEVAFAGRAAIKARFGRPIKNAAHLSIYNSKGRLVCRQHVARATSEMLIDVADISSGLYMALLESSEFSSGRAFFAK